jgi:hypothetical protein
MREKIVLSGKFLSFYAHALIIHEPLLILWYHDHEHHRIDRHFEKILFSKMIIKF